jgi:hypothetical protein
MIPLRAVGSSLGCPRPLRYAGHTSLGHVSALGSMQLELPAENLQNFLWGRSRHTFPVEHCPLSQNEFLGQSQLFPHAPAWTWRPAIGTRATATAPPSTAFIARRRVTPVTNCFAIASNRWLSTTTLLHCPSDWFLVRSSPPGVRRSHQWPTVVLRPSRCGATTNSRLARVTPRIHRRPWTKSCTPPPARACISCPGREPRLGGLVPCRWW